MFPPLLENPFRRPGFWGRQNELKTTYKYLLSDPPQHCAIIGETSIGKTTLLRHLFNPHQTSIVDELGVKNRFTFVYFDCSPYIGLSNLGDYASAQFWWNLYRELQSALQSHKQQIFPESRLNTNQVLIDVIFDIKTEIEDLIRSYQRPVVIMLDDFEGIARLPLYNSQWLRSIGLHYCTYIVASRYLLYLLYQDDSKGQMNPSPLWNIFSDPIYLGLMTEDEVHIFLLQASTMAKKLGSHWNQEDIDFIKKMAGRHPELIRIACVHLFEQRLQSHHLSKKDEHEFLEFSISRDANPICNELWYGLADPELRGEPRITKSDREMDRRTLSPYQKTLINIAKGEDSIEKKILFVLEERGLIEHVKGKWRVFAEIMRRFVLEQAQRYPTPQLIDTEQMLSPINREMLSGWETKKPISEPQSRVSPMQVATQVDASSALRQTRAFTHLEGEVYKYLKLHTGEVCDKEEIKSAVWKTNPPKDSALQKIIERIREKIEDDPENPQYLIAVRGRGYMLREDRASHSIASPS